jgi:hypothetical protein
MKHLSIFLILSLVFGSCTKNCKDAICTMEFTQVGVSLESKSNPDLEGIKTRTSISGTSEVVQENAGPFHSNNFTLVDDSNLKSIGFNSKKKVVFEVFLNQKLIHSENYEVGADCCHVRKVSGKESIVLD